VTDTVAERLRAINQEILSRTRLERIIDEFGLYENERKTGIMQDIVDQMRSTDIQINIPVTRRNEDTSSFTVSFTAEQPRTAMLVAERIASLFVQGNEQNRAQQAGTTSQFLEAQLEESRRRLKEQDDRIAAFRVQHAGRLPTQLQSNAQMMQTVQAQIQANVDAANRERDRLIGIEEQLAELESAAAAAGSSGDGAAATAPAAQQLEAARAALRNFQLRLKDDHPDVRTAKRVVAELEEKAEAEALAAPLSRGGPLAAAGATSREAERIRGLRAQAQEIRASLERRKGDDGRLQRQLEAYSARLEATPGVEAEFTDLMRDYATRREAYESLLKRADESKMAETLERRQIGERFSVIDSAQMPERPISPDRPRLYMMGLFGGLGLGLALAALFEYKDTTLKTDSDVLVSLALPVLAVIPAMTNGTERARRKRRTRLTAIGASVASALVVAAAVVWKLRVIQEWVR
jgi:polysaccharide chain length determinant protein (PEP-CTERM system associated)